MFIVQGDYVQFLALFGVGEKYLLLKEFFRMCLICILIVILNYLAMCIMQVAFFFGPFSYVANMQTQSFV